MRLPAPPAENPAPIFEFFDNQLQQQINKIQQTAPEIGRQALTDGVRVVACENTMHAQKLTKADMIPGIGYVPGGVVELMERQREGWAYIRP